MRKASNILVLITAVILITGITTQSSAGELPVTDYEFIRKMLLQPDADLSPFIGNELCDAFIYLIENDNTPQRERVVKRAITRFWVTEDERAVPYLIEYYDEYPMDCLYNLGHFSTPESCRALLTHISDDDEYNRRFAAESLGQLDYTVSEEMWELRDEVLSGLHKRLETEEEEWILPILNKAFTAVDIQVFPDTGEGQAG